MSSIEFERSCQELLAKVELFEANWYCIKCQTRHGCKHLLKEENKVFKREIAENLALATERAMASSRAAA